MAKTSNSILIVGLGLIGGSLAKALRLQYTDGEIAAMDADANVIRSALDEGVIDRAVRAGEPLDFDIVIICLYPTQIARFLRENAAFLRAGTIVTDVAGVKTRPNAGISSAVPEGVTYVSGHPMAGSEKSGYANSFPGMFRNANYLLIPVCGDTVRGIATLEEMALALGCRKAIVTDERTHDEMIAFTSQLPHVIAAAVGSSPLMARSEDFTGNSLKDVTRIAHFNDALWSELFLENGEALTARIDELTAKLAEIRSCIERGDRGRLREILRGSKSMEDKA